MTADGQLMVVSIVGARPQLVKAAAISRAFDRSSGVTETLIHTGQHFDSMMSDVFFEELGLHRPAHDLGVRGGTHGSMTGRMLERLDPLLSGLRPDVVITYGDTNSTLAGALSAVKLHLPVAHIEAGLRSFERRMPEEINRLITDHISTFNFCPTPAAVRNLEAEGVTENVYWTGDVMYDVALWGRERSRGSSSVLERLGLAEGEYSVATVHRAENTADLESLTRVVDYLRQRAEPQVMILPLHPRTNSAARGWGLHFDPIIVIEPVGYLDMCRLLSGASTVFTDSGGLQKEAYFFRVPCVTLRRSTEWTETIEAGWNRLWTSEVYLPRRVIPDYGSGTAAETIADQLVKLAGSAE